MAVVADLDLRISEFTAALKKAEGQLKGFSSRAANVGSSAGSGIGSGIISGVAASMAGLTALIAGAVAAAGVGAIVAESVKRAADAETAQVKMEVLLGNSDKAREVLLGLRKFAADTPFETPEITQSANALLAFGVGADDVLGTLTTIGDVASGVGVPLTEMADLYGKMRVQGRLFAQDVNQLTGRGIPVIQEFAKQFGVTTEEVKGLTEAGEISFANLEQAFKSLTTGSGKFGGMMARQAETLTGRWSTFKDEIGATLLELGKPIADELRPMLVQAIALTSQLKTVATGVGEAASSAMRYVVAAFQTLAGSDVAGLLKDALTFAAKEMVNFLNAGLHGAARAFAQLLIENFKNLATALSVLTSGDFWAGLGNVLKGIGLMFVALLEEGVGHILQQARDLPLVGKRLGADGDQLIKQSRDTQTEAQDALTTAPADFAPVLNQLMTRYTDALKAAGGAFKEGFTSAPNVMDTSAERARLGDLLSSVGGNVAKPSGALADMPNREAEKAALSGGAGGVVGMLQMIAKGTRMALAHGPVVEPRFATSGSLAGAINMIAGRSANELILANAKEHLESAKRQEKYLEEIKNNTKPKTNKPKPSPNNPAVFT
jgi:tape measure domain-containing protein